MESRAGAGEGVRARDHLSNTRTLLGWLRTGLVLLVLAYSVDKLHLLTGPRSGPSAWEHAMALVTASCGTLLLVFALAAFLGRRSAIESDSLENRALPAQAGMLAVAALGGLAAISTLVAGR